MAPIRLTPGCARQRPQQGGKTPAAAAATEGQQHTRNTFSTTATACREGVVTRDHSSTHQHDRTERRLGIKVHGRNPAAVRSRSACGATHGEGHLVPRCTNRMGKRVGRTKPPAGRDDDEHHTRGVKIDARLNHRHAIDNSPVELVPDAGVLRVRRLQAGHRAHALRSSRGDCTDMHKRTLWKRKYDTPPPTASRKRMTRPCRQYASADRPANHRET
jgi:hypothetical protein